jgi:hypothetical protein
MGVYPVVFQESIKAGTIPIQAFEEVKHRYTKEAIGVPFIARWGNGKQNSPIKPGTLSDALIGLQDLYATFAEITFQPMQISDGLDSQSFLGTLLGKKDENTRSSILIQANNGKYHGQQSKKSVRENSWKLICTKDLKPIELYNLANDPMESQNQIAEKSQLSRIKRMSSELRKILNSSRSTDPFLFESGEKKHTKTKIHSEQLFSPKANLLCQIKIPNGNEVQNWGDKWKVEGKSPMRISLSPKAGDKWDISGYKLAGIPIQNWEQGVTTIEGRLNNGNLTSWSHHAVGFAVAPSWEKTNLGVPLSYD